MKEAKQKRLENVEAGKQAQQNDLHQYREEVKKRDIQAAKGTYWLKDKSFKSSAQVKKAVTKLLSQNKESPYDVVKQLETEQNIAVFVQRLKPTKIQKLWEHEMHLAANEQAQTLREAAKKRLVFEFYYLSTKQIESSVQCPKFWELIGIHSDAAALGLRPEHFKVIASNISNKAILKMLKKPDDDDNVLAKYLYQVINELENSDPDAKAKLDAICPYLKKYDILKNAHHKSMAVSIAK